MKFSRRVFLGAGTGLLACKGWARGSEARVIVVGGGFAGATCARMLRRLAPEIAVTLIEPRRNFITGPMCNAALTGVMPMAQTRQGPAALRREGVTWIAEAARAVDPARCRVQLEDRSWLEADRLVIAPGIAMRWDVIEGLDETRSEKMPHAWAGDAQVAALQGQLAGLRRGGVVAISVPQNPYRCPPGPYERASLIAWRLSQRRQRGKVLLLDAKDDFSKRALFQSAWDELYPGLIAWHPRAEGGEVVAVDVRSRTLHLAGGERINADVACVIPPQRAADIAFAADLTDATGWCPVDPISFSSRRWPQVHVIGDAAQAYPMPKSATAANSQAKLCALSIIAQLRGLSAPLPRLVNTCYSLIAPEYGISVGGRYAAEGGHLVPLSEGMSPLAADMALREREAAHARDWYRGIVDDSFG